MLQKIRSLIKRMPFVESFLRTDTWANMRFRFLLRTSKRVNAPCTRFLRGPLQFEALLGPVLDMFLSDDKKQELKLIVAGCSIGSEPFTIASVLRSHSPEMEFKIHAFDIEEDIIQMAQTGIYPQEWVFNHKKITDEFVSSTFDKVEGKYKVKEEIARLVTFAVDDALDTTLKERIGQADILFAQNFLYHLPPKESRRALENLCTLLKPKSVLFLDGVDLEIRQSVTLSQGLLPLDFNIEAIHNDLRTTGMSTTDQSETRATAWPYFYWGLEPFSNEIDDWKRRYATVFIRDYSN